jgi:hypothetical protein
MITASWMIVIVTAAVCWGALGFANGFAMSAHRDALAGVRESSRFHFLNLLTRRSSELTSMQTLMVFPLILTLGAVLLALIFAPLLVALNFQLEGAVPVAAAVGFVSAFALRKVGVGVWAKIPSHAA